MSQKTTFKRLGDHQIKFSPLCGQISEILTNQDFAHLDIAMAENIKATQGHFHKTFTEIYLVVDGWVTLRLFDPKLVEKKDVTLRANELAVIPPGVHHSLVDFSESNRLFLICAPGFNVEDEYNSGVI